MLSSGCHRFVLYEKHWRPGDGRLGLEVVRRPCQAYRVTRVQRPSRPINDQHSMHLLKHADPSLLLECYVLAFVLAAQNVIGQGYRVSGAAVGASVFFAICRSASMLSGEASDRTQAALLWLVCLVRPTVSNLAFVAWTAVEQGS